MKKILVVLFMAMLSATLFAETAIVRRGQDSVEPIVLVIKDKEVVFTLNIPKKCTSVVYGYKKKDNTLFMMLDNLFVSFVVEIDNPDEIIVLGFERDNYIK